MNTPEKFNLKSMDITEDQLAKLKQVLPEVFTEGLKVDFDKLKQTLGDSIDTDSELFGMQWPGKSECFKIIQQPSIGTLKPCEEESVNWESSENLFIEGDNLEVLKLLQKSYYNKIKMIYIDPPYNTGKEFIYPDKYSETLNTYLEYSGQIDCEGRKFSTNTETEGRFHSKWMNMMYPRLFLAKNLLKEDGVIFISIDDNEVDNLKKICNDIFGEENFVANIIWEKKYSPSNDAKWLSDNHDHILLYAKNKEIWRPRLLPRTAEQNKRYTNRDNDQRGSWKPSDFSVKTYSANYDYPITTPSGRTVNPPQGRCWSTSQENFNQLVKDNRIWFGENGDNIPALKKFLTEVQDGLVPLTIWKYSEVGHNQMGRQEIKDLFDGKGFFDGPKPTSLLNRVAFLSTTKNDIILDFFAGSATTAHAVMQLNKEDAGNRKFIMVQLPEPCDEQSEAFKAGYKNIADIGKERIRRVIKKITTEQIESTEKEKEENPLFNQSDSSVSSECSVIQKQDLGFKVFKLDKSNFKIWDGEVDSESELAHQIELAIDHIDPDSKPEDILFEILLKAGFELTTKIAKLALSGKTVYSIEGNALLICLEDDLTKEVITEIAKLEPARVVCLDQGFKDNDQLKTNAVQIMKSHGVEDFRTV